MAGLECPYCKTLVCGPGRDALWGRWLEHCALCIENQARPPQQELQLSAADIEFLQRCGIQNPYLDMEVFFERHGEG